MDICIITNDAPMARFLILELAEAGFSASSDISPKDARLCIVDLDGENDIPADAVGFSYDDGKRSLVQSFLRRPVDAKKLRDTVTKRLCAMPEKELISSLEVERATRKVKTDGGEVRLSEKELALLEVLCRVPLLTREEGVKIFGGGDSNVVDVYMHYLRKKLSLVCQCETVKSKRGEGYALSDDLKIKFI